MKNEKFSMRHRIKSFAYAFDGLKFMWKYEHNFRVHLAAASIALALGLYFQIQLWEWVAILFAVLLVLGSEIINTVIENLCNYLTSAIDPRIKIIKDLAAAWVLVCSWGSLILAALIFIPKIFP